MMAESMATRSKAPTNGGRTSKAMTELARSWELKLGNSTRVSMPMPSTLTPITNWKPMAT